jgi:protein arginine N-methyltransferase 5
MPYSRVHTRQSQNPSPTLAQTPQPATPTPVIHQTWAFHHPNSTLPSLTPTTVGPSVTTEPSLSNAHNARVCTLTYPIANRGTCHGLAGYFETVLYRGVELSTNPNTMDDKSEGMISWFPIYFPLKVCMFSMSNLAETKVYASLVVSMLTCDGCHRMPSTSLTTPNCN